MSRLVSNEAPRPGVPSPEEMGKHYGKKVWAYFTAHLCVSRYGWRYTGATSSGPHEFIEGERVAPGFPDLCREYGLLPLEPGGGNSAPASRP